MSMAVLLKIGLMLVSVLLAGAIWYGLVRVLVKSGISSLQTLAVWISHLSFIGWLLFVAISVLFYLGFSRMVRLRVRAVN